MTQTETPQIPPETLKAALLPHLFPPENGLNTFAILDGASIPDLLDHLYGDVRPEFVCLYRGELEPDMAEVAPYLVRLEQESPFTDWLVTEGWGNHWGIFALTKADVAATRKHFRTFLMVKDPQGKQLYFRYYDPRVLRLYLPTCNSSEMEILFGPVVRYFSECEEQCTLLCFSPGPGTPVERRITLGKNNVEKLPLGQEGIQGAAT